MDIGLIYIIAPNELDLLRQGKELRVAVGPHNKLSFNPNFQRVYHLRK